MCTLPAKYTQVTMKQERKLINSQEYRNILEEGLWGLSTEKMYSYSLT